MTNNVKRNLAFYHRAQLRKSKVEPAIKRKYSKHIPVVGKKEQLHHSVVNFKPCESQIIHLDLSSLRPKKVKQLKPKNQKHHSQQ